MIYVGTSGFSYPEWKGIFYPEKLAAKHYLSFYAQHFSSTEINNTFYRSPSETTAGHWAEQVPKHFRFTLKLNQKITHKNRLGNVDDAMEWFLKGAAPLGDKLGTLLVQLPPYFREDKKVLEDFLQKYSKKAALAFEFRHPSWLTDNTFELLEAHAVALVVAESDERPALRTVTAPFVYVRLRKSEYSEDELQEWARWIASQKREAFVYLKHDTEAPRLAKQLIRHCSLES
ncbi:DUF72 domain-containing protein [Acidobacteria bacterium AH-259-G07]|nr:DUF72 domain-containing protein [Acidobacteria bacterium AH-259-G07]